MSTNPYASPASTSASTERTREIRLYTPQHVGVATLLGGPLAGCLLMATNYRRMGKSDAATVSVLFGLLAGVALAVIGITMPSVLSGFGPIVCIASIIVMRTLAQNTQGSAVEAHTRRGGKTDSAWNATGIGVVVLAAQCAALFGFAMLVL